jgi:hypothetical protein
MAWWAWVLVAWCATAVVSGVFLGAVLAGVGQREREARAYRLAELEQHHLAG